MRNKREILKDASNTTDLGIPFERRIIHLETFKLEALIDIRDILNERLLEIDKGLHELISTTKMTMRDAATAIIMAYRKSNKEH